MSGQQDSLSETTKERLKKFEEILQTYVDGIGIGTVSYYPLEVNSCMSLTYDEILKLNEEECAAKAFVLSRFAIYIQKEFNRQQVRIKWAKTNLDGTLAKEGDKYGDKYTKYDQKLAMLCNDNSQAKTLSDIVLYAEARMLELNELSKHLTLISRTLSDMRQTKRKYYTHEKSE